MSLTLLAHGSPDPRHAQGVAALSGRLKVAGIASNVAYLDHDRPTPAAAARALAESGLAETTVVPLLLSPAYHARVDVHADQVGAAEPPAPPAPSSMSAEEAITALRGKIDRLGPVNMMAIEQFDELESRHAFLTTQRQDLIESIAQ